MLIHSYERKILVKIPPMAFQLSIFDSKIEKKLKYKFIKGKREMDGEIDLDYADSYDVNNESILMRISPDKLEIYRNKKKKNEK